MTRLRSRRGHSLIEVVVAVLILAIAVLGLYSVVASSARATGEVDDQAALDASVRKAQAVLALYVSADVSGDTAAAHAPNGSWRLDGDSCATALQVGCTHDATTLVDSSLKAKYPAARMTYTVTKADEDSSPQVTFSVTW